jgi:N-acetyl-anhydromuramyl-L-alanine amidase AmpD
VIIVDRPPNFDQVLAAFPRADQPGVLFAYYPNIHNPSGIVVPPALVAHEEVHLHRQRDAGPIRWWDQYLTDTEFRYNEELLAHVAEFKHQKNGDRNASARLLLSTALRLVAPLYAYEPPRTLQQAMRDLRQELQK